VIYSGDIGNRNKPVIRDPQYPGQAEIMVVETTYGDRNHRNIAQSVEELRDAIIETFKRGGNVLIPSFAIERSQELLFILRDLMARDQLPRCSVFLDSPMAISVTEIMRRHPEYYDAATARLLAEGIDPFEVPGALFTRTPAASKQINYIKSGAIIIAGSGMCAGGRIRLHMKHNIWRSECSLVFMGFQAAGTLGREIVEGAKQVSILGEAYPVHCKVHTIGGFSSHADREILLDWVGANKALQHLFLVHGEKSSTEAFKQGALSGHLAGDIIIPQEHEVYTL
jgi:metallo-beta-lactamase family protein